ncbi:hypothetical protein [Streptomyces sp. NPDC001292]|uniref:hypothetical protein n=1 Tax=Streptomyces sp. NPDC001292 TaxID=3364558 RepID=UPI0036C34D85
MIELPSSVPGETQFFPTAITYRDITQALDQAGRPWQPYAALTFGDQCALTALPSGATFAFKIDQDTEPVLNVVGLPSAIHDCPTPTWTTP